MSIKIMSVSHFSVSNLKTIADYLCCVEILEPYIWCNQVLWQASWQAGRRQIDKQNAEFLKFAIDRNF